MKFRIYEADGYTYYCIDEHRAEIFRYNIGYGGLSDKLNLVDEFLKTEHAKFKKYTQKDVLKDFSKTDKQIANYYKTLYPRGGSRKNAGRKVGSYQAGIKSGRTERFTKAITQEEKEFLTRQLAKFRNGYIK